MENGPSLPDPNTLVNSPVALRCGGSNGFDKVMGVSAGWSLSNGPRKKFVKSPALASSDLAGVTSLSAGTPVSDLKLDRNKAVKPPGSGDGGEFVIEPPPGTLLSFAFAASRPSVVTDGTPRFEGALASGNSAEGWVTSVLGASCDPEKNCLVKSPGRRPVEPGSGATSISSRSVVEPLLSGRGLTAGPENAAVKLLGGAALLTGFDSSAGRRFGRERSLLMGGPPFEVPWIGIAISCVSMLEDS